MTSINATAEIAALIRSQVASLRKPSGSTASKSQSKHGKLQDERDIAALIAQRVKVIDPDDPQRERKAFRIFLESVLLAELGGDLINDPAFYQMVEDVQLQMESDPGLALAVSQAAKLLLAPLKK
ncbi:hypothetical protein [Collimonas sp.]|jgi:hypothetical protein|uniref:hypothetical protein n=1 Tax=Collimonas sp. TaxID=1963772 RepID=UPI002C841D19|nr:hypothetical protein [Collimonas sp.]HWW08333.1 hypothetical protein [Collimonas sp.]